MHDPLPQGEKVLKGGQTVLCADVGRNRVKSYTHRHKEHDIPEGYAREVSRETHWIAELLEPIV